MLDFQIQPLSQVFRALEQELHQNTQNKAQSFWTLEEDDKSYYLLLDTPGMDREGLDIEMNGTELVIKWSYAKATRKTVGGKIRPTNFEHRFKMSENIDSSNIQATYNNGVLELMLAKQEKSLIRKISISDSSFSGDNLKN